MIELVDKGRDIVWNNSGAAPFQPLVMQPDKCVGEPDLHQMPFQKVRRCARLIGAGHIEV